MNWQANGIVIGYCTLKIYIYTQEISQRMRNVQKKSALDVRDVVERDS